ncbi:unnamed protein product [Staurois parvus]|uniref:Ribonuclease A-domain domain-containing protein n=1 Tax=Staurois parvus TaxID=386267 RepID=A0ABN9HJX7_9NEOB|nr:unnamed protein product [Staurois parvus]
MFSVATLLLVYGILFGLPQNGGAENWATFQRKHISSNSTTGFNCTKAMSDSIFIVNGQCKSFNTFIHAVAGRVKEICKGVKGHKNKTSPNAYDLTECTKATRCEYNGRNQRSKICVTCENSVPIHFVRRGNLLINVCHKFTKAYDALKQKETIQSNFATNTLPLTYL